MNYWKEFVKGIIKENPLFVIMLGCCPSLAVTTSALNGAAMGVAASAVLMSSNVIISLIRRIVPSEIRIPCYIVVIASFVTMVDLLMQAYLPPALVSALGVFIPLIVVNCIILGRAEAFAGKNNVLASLLDGAGMGLGYFLALVLVGSIREILGNGTWLGISLGRGLVPMKIFVQAPGAFLVLGLLLGFFAWLRQRRGAAKE